MEIGIIKIMSIYGYDLVSNGRLTFVTCAKELFIIYHYDLEIYAPCSICGYFYVMSLIFIENIQV